MAGAPTGANKAYQAALAALFSRTTGVWRLGLERVQDFLGRLGNPQVAYPVFHVAGTNGKGSTIATLDALLRGAGYRVGRYTSPHLVDFGERIVVNNVPMTPEAIVEWLARWDPEAARNGSTFFEVTTAMAFSHFAQQRVDVALVEVGLGGRLDATNVVNPVAAAVTQIGIDHVEFLGNSLEAIAAEKAGVFKRGVAAIVGEVGENIRDRLAILATAAGASPVLVQGRDWQVSNIEVTPAGTTFMHTADGRATHLRTPLVGAFQAHNASVALAMLRGAGGQWAEVAGSAAQHLPSVHIAGRFHRAGRYVFDVAHNADGAATVAANVRGLALPKPVVAVVTVLRDKDWKGILTALGTVADEIIVTAAPTAPSSRAWDPDEVMAWATEGALPAVLETNFDRALARASETGATILVTGSFHTVGDAMERLQVDPLAR